MKMTRITVPAIALSALLAACGDSGNAALSKQFSYGAPAAPTASESAAATSAQSGLQDATSFTTAPDATRGMNIVAFASTLAAAALDAGSPFSMTQRQHLGSALRTATSLDTCAAVTTGSVTFKNCTVSESGYSLSINGSISVASNTVTWDVSAGFSGSDTDGTSINISWHQAGTFTVTSTKVTGHSTAEFGGSLSAQGQTVKFGFATAAVVDLTYQASPFCVSSGSVEVKRVWTEKPPGASGPQFSDAAVKITWTGCDAIQVAHST